MTAYDTSGRQPLVAPLRRAPITTRRGPRPQGVEQTRWLRPVAAAAFASTVAWYLVRVGMGHDLLIGLVLIPLICLAAWPIFRVLARRETQLDLMALLFLGLSVRFFAASVRFEGAVDAGLYHRIGVQLADSFRRFDFNVDTGRDIPGTGSLRYFSGLVSVVTGSSMIAEFLVFTTISFAGIVLFYLAFRTAFPDGDALRYGLLLFLWPSLAYWPSSIGKEAVIVFCTGLASFGAARLYAHLRGGIIVIVLGSAGIVMIRPHIALIVLAAIGLGFVFVRSVRGSMFLSGTKIIAIALLLVGVAVMASSTAEFFDVDTLGTESVSNTLDATQASTSQGESRFTPINANNPALLPLAVVTVVVRPFPFEARGTEALISAAEGVVLIGLVVLSWKRLRNLPRAVLSRPYVAYAASMVLLFAYAFSAIGNFGILARQRTQMLPLFFVLLALPIVLPRLGENDAPDDAAPGVGAPTSRTS